MEIFKKKIIVKLKVVWLSLMLMDSVYYVV